MTKKKKQRFEVQQHETIEECLNRIKTEGYTPVRRIEEPIFHEVVSNGKKEIEPCGRKILFEGVLME